MTVKEASEWLMAIKRDYIHGGDEDYDKRRKIALDMGAEALENQKTGHWIKWYEEVDYRTYTENILHCKCSECNKEYDPYTSLFIRYCSRCGAKMEGDNNG